VTELPPLLDEHSIDPAARAGVLAYVKGLQDWQSGGHEWHMRSSRYMNEGSRNSPTGQGVLGGPTGLGTSAARIATSLVSSAPQRVGSFSHVPFQVVGPVPLPDFHMPFTLRLSQHLDASRDHVAEWAGRMGMFEVVPGVPGSGVWDERKARVIDLPLCAAGLHPDATLDELNLTSDWLAWGTYGDDYYPVVFGRTQDRVGAKVCTERLSYFMPVDDTPIPVPANALERGLADLWSRTAGPMTGNARRVFRRAVEDMTSSWLWELSNQWQNRIPDPVDYVEMRRKTFGSDLTMSLSRVGHGQTVPPEIYRTRTIQAMENAAQDYACLLNDVFSYQKEIQFEGEIHNAVLVVQNFLDCDLDRALQVVNDLMTARMQQFEHVVDVELPVLFEDHDLDSDARRNLVAYTEELKNWLTGILNWHQNCDRYVESELRRHPAPGVPPFGGPTGLGTSAARIAPRHDPGALRAFASK
jgi:germacradienol/geosmin synthase